MPATWVNTFGLHGDTVKRTRTTPTLLFHQHSTCGANDEGVLLSVIPLSHQRDESGDGSSLCFSSRSPAILDGHGRELLMSEAGTHIRPEKRKEIHEPVLESKSPGVEHLTSGQCTAYLWMKRDAERLAQVCSSQCSRLLASASVSGQKLLPFQVIYHQDRGAGGLRPLRWRSRPLPRG